MQDLINRIPRIDHALQEMLRRVVLLRDFVDPRDGTTTRQPLHIRYPYNDEIHTNGTIAFRVLAGYPGLTEAVAEYLASVYHQFSIAGINQLFTIGHAASYLTLRATDLLAKKDQFMPVVRFGKNDLHQVSPEPRQAINPAKNTAIITDVVMSGVAISNALKVIEELGMPPHKIQLIYALANRHWRDRVEGVSLVGMINAADWELRHWDAAKVSCPMCKDGLPFTCSRFGPCITGSPDNCLVSDSEFVSASCSFGERPSAEIGLRRFKELSTYKGNLTP